MTVESGIKNLDKNTVLLFFQIPYSKFQILFVENPVLKTRVKIFKRRTAIGRIKNIVRERLRFKRGEEIKKHGVKILREGKNKAHAGRKNEKRIATRLFHNNLLHRNARFQERVLKRKEAGIPVKKIVVEQAGGDAF